jgi:hypothetical protein
MYKLYIMLKIKMRGRGEKEIFIDIITLDIMSKAISNRIGIRKEKSRRIAEFILDLFGYDNRIIDNILQPEDRQLLYMLESEGLLSTGREEVKLYDGREWLTHYWQLKKKYIVEYAFNIKNKLYLNNIKNKNNMKKDIYSTLSDDVWNMRKILKKSHV